MSRPTNVDDGGEDIYPQPDPNVPNQDQLPDQMPSEDYKQPVPLEQDGETESLLADVDDAQGTLEQAGEIEESPPIAPDEPQNDPEPTDDTTDLSLDVPELSEDSGPRDFTEDATGADMSADVSSAPAEDSTLEDLDRAAKDLADMGADINAFHEGGGMDGFQPPMDFGTGGSGEGGGDNSALQNLGDTDISNRDTMTDFLIAHERRIAEVTQRLERERL